jgi:transcription initiation factor IIE alpha subunit
MRPRSQRTSDIVLPVDPPTDELKVEIVDLLRAHSTRTDDELVKGTGVRRFEILRPAVRALESDGTIVKSGDDWMLAP